jgi:hypothetical protein
MARSQRVRAVSRICYVERTFHARARSVIAQANAICEEYTNQGLALTLRQLHYQFVARGLYENTAANYDRLGRIVSDARLAGELDWAYIVDRTRNLVALSHWDDPGQIIEAAAKQFRTDKWAEQPKRVEVWVEKNALAGVLDSVCPSEDVPYFATIGYNGQSEQWAAARRLGAYIADGQSVVILHLGDHDPQGIDMTRDIRERLALFIGKDIGYSLLDKLEVKRIALTMDQVREHNPPPNFVKESSITRAYVEEFGPECWELDALEPAFIVDLIRSEIEACRDSDLWVEATGREALMRRELNDALGGSPSP